MVEEMSDRVGSLEVTTTGTLPSGRPMGRRALAASPSSGDEEGGRLPLRGSRRAFRRQGPHPPGRASSVMGLPPGPAPGNGLTRSRPGVSASERSAREGAGPVAHG